VEIKVFKSDLSLPEIEQADAAEVATKSLRIDGLGVGAYYSCRSN